MRGCRDSMPSRSKRILVLAACALVALLSVSPGSALARKGSNAACPGGYEAKRPYPAFGAIGFGGYATCVSAINGTTIAFDYHAYLILWALEHDGHWHQVASTHGGESCFSYSSAYLCTMTPSNWSGPNPPMGRYHAQLLVYAQSPYFPGYINMASLNSEDYCYNRFHFTISGCP
jgi:hypothetical protein